MSGYLLWTMLGCICYGVSMGRWSKCDFYIHLYSLRRMTEKGKKKEERERDTIRKDENLNTKCFSHLFSSNKWSTKVWGRNPLSFSLIDILFFSIIMRKLLEFRVKSLCFSFYSLTTVCMYNVFWSFSSHIVLSLLSHTHLKFLHVPIKPSFCFYVFLSSCDSWV